MVDARRLASGHYSVRWREEYTLLPSICMCGMYGRAESTQVDEGSEFLACELNMGVVNVGVVLDFCTLERRQAIAPSERLAARSV